MRRVLGLLALAAVFCLGMAAVIVHRVHRTLQIASRAVRQQTELPFILQRVPPSNGPGFKSILGAGGFEHAAVLEGEVFISSPTGISSYSPQGVLRRTWRTGVDLPPAPIHALAVARLRNFAVPGLIAATTGEGVLFLDPVGGAVQQLLPLEAGARDITALLPLPAGDLLLGTRSGVLVWTGDSLRRFHPQLDGLQVTALAPDSSGGFWVGTRDAGLLHWTGGTAEHFTAPESLPDTDVESLAVVGDRVFAGTPMGVREFMAGQPARLLAANTFASSLLPGPHDLTIATIDQGALQVSLDAASRPHLIPSERPEGDIRAFVMGEDGTALALTAARVLRRDAHGRWAEAFAAPDATLTDANISALTFDADGHLWVGYFDHGLDILGPDHTKHIETDRVFCINRLALDPARGTVLAATANGLVVFDRAGDPVQVLTHRDGLIADHVTDISFSSGGLALATSAGLTFMDSGSAPASLYAFQGLVNNHVYALATQPGGEVLAGTLGGLSLLAHENVVRNFTVANSGLKHNWITAISPAPGGAWTVGTYGAGVFELTSSGAVISQTPAFVVNPNAMLRTRTHLAVGTLGQGLWVESIATGHWVQITAGLPSLNVTAFAERHGTLYVGTEAGLVTIAEGNLPQ